MKNMNLLKKLAIFSMLTIFLGSLSGCAAFLAGAGAISIGMDTMRLERYTEYDTAWDATINSIHELSAELEAWESGLVPPKWTEGEKWERNQIMKHRMEVSGREMERKYP